MVLIQPAGWGALEQRKIFTMEKKMATNRDILLRDAFADTGQIPSPSNYPYSSPDIVPTQTTLTQATLDSLKSNYDHYVPPLNDQALISGKYNYFYIRAKNISSETIANARVALYWSTANLLMSYSSWKNNKLTVKIGDTEQDYVPLETMAAEAVGLGTEIFNWNIPDSSHHCLVARAYIPGVADPHWPPPDNIFEFSNWIRSNPNIAWRNLTINNNPNLPEFDHIYGIPNPSGTMAPVFVTTIANGLVPVGTTIRMRDAGLNIDKRTTIVAGDRASRFLNANGLLTEPYSSVQVTAQTPGGNWPNGAQIATLADVGVQAPTQAVKLHGDFAQGTFDESTSPWRLVRVGNCVWHTATS